MPVVTIKLSEIEYRALEKEARKRNKSKSSLLREAFAASVGRSDHGSAYDLASDVIGKSDGPADLSVNRDYLEGYGERKNRSLQRN
jgi:ribbon-helix-helix CopG family protein